MSTSSPFRQPSIGSRLLWRCSQALIALGLAVSAQAGPFTSIQVFGDSLSDTGNVFAASGGTIPPSPYFNGRFSNGPVAVETLAAKFNAPLISHAYGGATTGLLNNAAPPPLANTGILSQLNGYLGAVGPGGADANALYVLWGGPNDFFALLSGPGDPLAIATGVVTNLSNAVVALYANGARNFLLPLLPDLGLIPQVQGLPGVPAQLTALSLQTNQSLAATYGVLAGLFADADLTVFDTLAAQQNLLANAAAFGITNTTEACYTGFVDTPPGTVCANPNSYLFWDKQHPTAVAHALLGELMYQQVPVPATLALVLTGLALVSLRRRSA